MGSWVTHPSTQEKFLSLCLGVISSGILRGSDSVLWILPGWAICKTSCLTFKISSHPSFKFFFPCFESRPNGASGSKANLFSMFNNCSQQDSRNYGALDWTLVCKKCTKSSFQSRDLFSFTQTNWQQYNDIFFQFWENVKEL